MKEEVVSLWKSALLSGRYQQAKGSLGIEVDGQSYFCCLGVLCELAIQAGMPVTRGKVTHSDGVSYFSYDGRHEVLPSSVLNWLGLSEEDPTCISPQPRSSMYKTRSGEWVLLSELNDGGTTFEQIATVHL